MLNLVHESLIFPFIICINSIILLLKLIFFFSDSGMLRYSLCNVTNSAFDFRIEDLVTSNLHTCIFHLSRMPLSSFSPFWSVILRKCSFPHSPTVSEGTKWWDVTVQQDEVQLWYVIKLVDTVNTNAERTWHQKSF